MAATTISDLPRDMLVLIFRAVIGAAGLGRRPDIHKNLRCVSREWRDAADIAYIEDNSKCFDLNIGALQDPATVRCRFPSMVRVLEIDRTPRPLQCEAPTMALAVSSLCASADLRRVLRRASLSGLCCAVEAAAAASAIAACPHLTYLNLGWEHIVHGDNVQPDMLTSLTALTGLKELAMKSGRGWPTLPDIPSLSSLELKNSRSTFAIAGSAAILGRLRRLSLSTLIIRGLDVEWASDDPFRLRADLDAGAWRPHLLTSVQNLRIDICRHERKGDEFDDEWEPRVFDGAAPAAAVWAPLAATVTKLTLICLASIFNDSDLETGMYAGLGVLTGLQALVVYSSNADRSPVDFGRVHLPHLTSLLFRGYDGPPIDVARFPRLALVDVGSHETEPLVLASVAALGRLASLRMRGLNRPPPRDNPKPRLNLAQLFGVGRLAALTQLSFDRVTLTWDATTVAGAPPASEFATRARALLPALRSVNIKDDTEMDEDVREFVVPAVRALGRG